MMNKIVKQYSLICIFRSSIVALTFLMGLSMSLQPSFFMLLSMVIMLGMAILINQEDSGLVRKKITLFLIYPVIIWLLVTLIQLLKEDSPATTNAVILLNLYYSSLLVFLLIYSNLNIIILKIAQYLILLYFLYMCIVQGGIDPEVFVYSSRSYIIAILLSVSITLQVLHFNHNKTINILPPILIVFISFYTWSRTGLICGLLYLAIIVTMGIEGVNKKSWRYLFFIVLLLGGAYLYNHFSFWDEIEVFTKFEEKGMDLDGRDNYWIRYFSKFDFFDLLFGGHIVTVESGVQNLHNSIIQLHGQLGLLGLFLIIYIIRRLFFCLKNNLFLFGLFGTLLVLCSMNFVYFFTIYDFAIGIFILSDKKFLIKDSTKQVRYSLF